MKPLSTVLLILCAFLAHGPTWAAVIQRDWKTPGDGLLTYDDVNQREWLDIPVSLLDQFGPGSLEQRFQRVVLETMPGGAFEGFAVGSRADAIGLAESAGIDTTTQDFATNDLATATLINLLGETVTYSDGGGASLGFVKAFFPPPSSSRQIAFFERDLPGLFVGGEAGLKFIGGE